MWSILIVSLHMCLLKLPSVDGSYGLLSSNRLAFPTSQLISYGRPTSPVGISPGMCEQLRDLVPALCGRGSWQIEGLGDGLTGDGQLQGQEPGVERCHGAPTCVGRVWRLWVWARRAARIDAMSEACSSVFREQGRSASIASRRCTDLSSLMLSSTS